jgi:hypothetical protein
VHGSRAALDLRYDSACFANDDNAGADIPRVKIPLPIGVKTAGGDKSKVQRGGAELPDAGGLGENTISFLERDIASRPALECQAGRENDFLKRGAA